MKDERKNIDELFSEGLGNFSPTPPPDLWDRIGTGLPASGPAPVIPASGTGRLPLIGIAVAVITGIAVLWFLMSNNNSKTEKSETVQQKEMPVKGTSVAVADKMEETGKSVTDQPSVRQNTETVNIKNQPGQTNKIPTVKFSDPENVAAQAGTKNRNIQPAPATILNAGTTNPVSLKETSMNVPTLAELRLDFTNWLNAQPANFITASATSAFSNQYKKSNRLAMPKGSRIPVIGGVYTAWDLIGYGNGHNKQSRAAGIVLSTFSGSWLFETGAALCLSDDNGKFLVNYDSFDSIGYYNKVVSFSVNPQNPGTIQFNTEVQEVFDTVDHNFATRTTSRYTYLQIPLMAGYRLYSNRLLSITLKAGPVFSLLLGSDEPTASFSRDGANLKSIDNLSPSRVSTNWQVAAGLGVGLNLSRRLTLLAEPTYKTYLRPVYQGYRTKPQSIGIRAGLLYRF